MSSCFWRLSLEVGAPNALLEEWHAYHRSVLGNSFYCVGGRDRSRAITIPQKT